MGGFLRDPQGHSPDHTLHPLPRLHHTFRGTLLPPGQPLDHSIALPHGAGERLRNLLHHHQHPGRRVQIHQPRLPIRLCGQRLRELAADLSRLPAVLGPNDELLHRTLGTHLLGKRPRLRGTLCRTFLLRLWRPPLLCIRSSALQDRTALPPGPHSHRRHGRLRHDGRALPHGPNHHDHLRRLSPRLAQSLEGNAGHPSSRTHGPLFLRAVQPLAAKP